MTPLVHILLGRWPQKRWRSSPLQILFTPAGMHRSGRTVQVVCLRSAGARQATPNFETPQALESEPATGLHRSATSWGPPDALAPVLRNLVDAVMTDRVRD